MGNQLVNSVKTVIRPIDYYLSEVPDCKLKCSLGQTQFLKVALCNHAEGQIVVKVLPFEDPTLPLEQYRHELLELSKITAGNISIASFRIVEIRTNFAYMVRQHILQSLYDRLSTRPFLTDIEKAWIVYQIFKCMEWCHERKIFHGDLKMENILITSNLWVVITDFASYKPVRLPDDNPSFFNYFFDTSRRRCCNIAPERFVSSNLNNQQIDANTAQQSIFSSFLQEGKLTYKMDMFSIGCVLAELFSDNFLFDLSRLLSYKERKCDDILKEHINQVENDQIRNLIQNLISLNTNERKTCTKVLADLRGTYFPNHFDQLYVLMFDLTRMPPDSRILHLIDEVNRNLNKWIEENPKSLLIILMSITSAMRNLKHVYCEIQSQRLICRLVLASNSLSIYITDRLIPYFVHCLGHNDHRVRGESINSIVILLEQVTNLPNSDNNIFTDYLMKNFLKCLTNEKSTYVRMCMAKNLGQLSKIALRFLNQHFDHNYDEELKSLHKDFEKLVSLLLTDCNNCVRRILLLTPDNCAQLCTFFGRQKTNEVILSHIITFLNDKNDFQLRFSFFDNIVVIASYLGAQCSTLMHPLLQQGLCDPEEMIISKTIMAIGSLAEQGLLTKNVIVDLLKEIIPLLYHPNSWIQHAIMHFIACLKIHLSLVDLNTKILPILRPYCKSNLDYFSIQLFRQRLLAKSLPRSFFEKVFLVKEQKILTSFFQLLEMKATQPKYDNQLLKDHNIIYKRLLAENISNSQEKQFLALKEIIMKIYYKRNYLISPKNSEYSNVIEYKKYDNVRSKEIKLVNASYLQDAMEMSSGNTEWQHMFGPNNNNNNSKAFNPASSSANLSAAAFLHGAEVRKNLAYYQCPPCSRDVHALEQHKRNDFIPFPSMTVSLSTSFKPRGDLIAHLYEHKSSVNQMVRYNKSNMFLTCSDDGSIRLWDISEDPTRYVISRSRFQFRMEFLNGSPLNFKGIVCCGNFVISYSSNCAIHVFEILDSAILLTCRFKVARATRSTAAVSITSICALNESLFAVSLTNSLVYIYDTRFIYSTTFNVPVFKLHISPSQRTITSIDGNTLIIFAGTACGYIAGFDLRFYLKVANYMHNENASTRIAKIKYTKNELITSTYGNFDVSLWDYTIGQKSKILVACNTNRMASRTENSSKAVVNALLPIQVHSSNVLVTGGSDMRIRYWNLSQAEESYLISDPLLKPCHLMYNKQQFTNQSNKVHQSKSPSNTNKPPTSSPSSASSSSSSSSTANKKNIRYTQIYGWNSSNTQLTHYKAINQSNGVVEFQETDSSSTSVSMTSNSLSYQDMTMHSCPIDHQVVSFAHQNSITDLIHINDYLVSSCRDGTVKVWR